ncbi:MAG: MFS transporter [Candidatus Njordarchaeales archaeon]
MENRDRLAYLAILLFGLVSLFGDIIYEGARGIISPYLEFLGATAIIVGIVGGVGDFIGYALRLVSGYLADVKKTYWLFVFLGYGLLITVPLLAFAPHLSFLAPAWVIASILVILERLGKALRSPARDTLLSVTTKDIGAGKAFGLHEFMDQLGAIIGPSIMAIILYLTNNEYFYAFSIMFIPYVILVVILFLAYSRLKEATEEVMKETRQQTQERRARLPRRFYMYAFAVFLNTSGLLSALLILYVASYLAHLPAWEVSVLFIIIQGVDALVAPLAGFIYDRVGISLLTVPFVLSILPTFFALQGSRQMVYLAALSFGIILGMQESVYRAAVSDITTVEARGTAYGFFSTLYGAGFLVSGAIFGLFIEYNLYIMAVIYTLLVQFLGIALLLLSTKTKNFTTK